jgi:uncharacterized membrane protein required for colicin V production
VIVVDAVIVVILLAAIAAGAARGLVASIGALIGLIVGALAVYWLAPIVSGVVPWPVWRAVLVVALSIGLLAGGAALGSAFGMAIRRGVDRTPLRTVDRVLGAAASFVIAALTVSLVGSTVTAIGIPTVSSAVASSRVLQGIDSVIPAPVQATLAQVRGVVLSEGLPRLGIALPTIDASPQPPVKLDDPALAKAAASVARISGVAYACGKSLTGSGFVIARDEVLTNAHVVAGVQQPVVELPGRDALEGRIVYFDPEDDLAVVSVPGLDASPLRVTTTLGAGSSAVVAGYPFGGPFTMGDARVLSSGVVGVPDIYDARSTDRDIYALQATVSPGNSGGPLLTAAGSVAGLVFARSADSDDRGYAMTPTVFSDIVAEAPTLTAPVSSGRCAAE